jgi:serine/threonine protein kinase
LADVFEQGLELTVALVAGTRLGTYDIPGELGSGGVGDVYRTTDKTPERQVAIKTLPRTLARDPDRLARSKRQAKLLAALNQPHIASVYGLEERDGALYLAMELAEGEMLERVSTGDCQARGTP